MSRRSICLLPTQCLRFPTFLSNYTRFVTRANGSFRQRVLFETARPMLYLRLRGICCMTLSLRWRRLYGGSVIFAQCYRTISKRKGYYQNYWEAIHKQSGWSFHMNLVQPTASNARSRTDLSDFLLSSLAPSKTWTTWRSKIWRRPQSKSFLFTLCLRQVNSVVISLVPRSSHGGRCRTQTVDTMSLRYRAFQHIFIGSHGSGTFMAWRMC